MPPPNDEMSIAAIITRIAAIEVKQVEADQQRTATALKVDAIHNALMGTQPGDDSSFLDRATTLLRSVESGERVMGWLIGGSKVFIAIAVIIAGIVAAFKYGISEGGKP